MSKPRVGFYWCASCGGCEEAVVDLAEEILGVVEAVDIAFWPVALDFKRSDVEAMPDGHLAVTFLNGAIRTSEQEEMAELLRRKSQVLIAFGSCSHLGGIPGLANQHDRESIFDRVYVTAPSMEPGGTLPAERTAAPEGTLTLPAFRDTVRTLDQVVDVDYYLPGCPPPVRLVRAALQAILAGSLPERGAVLAPDVALCEECPRKTTKPERPMVKEFRRPHEIEIDPETCLFAQGLLCLGPATRAGCDAACVAGNMPCTGCMGPTGNVRDQGAKALSAVAALLDASEPAAVSARLAAVVDPVGTFYRYSLPASFLHRRVRHAVPGNGGNGGAKGAPER
jgi:F420-non-reducing hydrogenase small subunit